MLSSAPALCVYVLVQASRLLFLALRCSKTRSNLLVLALRYSATR